MNYQPLVYLLSALLGLTLSYLVFQGVKLRNIYKSMSQKPHRRMFITPRVEYKYYESDDVLTVELD